MAVPRGLIRNHDGSWVPFGAVKREYSEGFLTGTTASWLTVSAGTQTYVTSGVAPYTQIQSGAVSGNQAVIKSSFTMNTNYIQGILFEADGLFFDATANFDFNISINAGGGLGGYARMASTDSLFKLYTGGVSAGSATATNVNTIRSGEGVLRHNLGLLLLPTAKELFLLHDRQVVGYRDASSTTINGAVSAALELTTQEAVAHSIRVQQLRLTVWTN